MILVVDDDLEIADLVEVYLRNDGYQVIKAGDGKEAQLKMEKEEIELIVLDNMMPVMNGLDFCKWVRKKSQVPILMLSAKAEDMDKIVGLMTGADDYLIKPFNPLELTTRVKALLRRANYKEEREGKSRLYIGSLIIDKESHTVETEEVEVNLTALEFNILYLLASNRGRVFSSDEIFERVWNERGEGSNKTVMMHISNVRDKLDEAAHGEVIIKTVWGVGYKIEK